MIFSFSELAHDFVLPEQSRYDILCFFNPKISSISCPEHTWFQVMCASLRLKKDVVILEAHFERWPAIKENQRWQWGEGWVAIEARALHAILTAYPKHSTNLEQFRHFLSTL